MKLFSENIEDLRTLYVTGLKKALDMEQKITKALPTMIEILYLNRLAIDGRRTPVRIEPRKNRCRAPAGKIDGRPTGDDRA